LVWWLYNLFLVRNYPNKKPKNNGLTHAINAVLLFVPLFGLVLIHQQTSLLLLLFLVVWGADTFAYFFGKNFGKHKLALNLSGGKTIEGVAGGLLGVLIITSVWMFYYNEVSWKLLLLALITGVFSVIGDLYESIYKREAGAKDSGKILPGHGGVFDRIDGLLAATPIFVTGIMLLQ
jgi:phosphatidate cytidylyltransferase